MSAVINDQIAENSVISACLLDFEGKSLSIVRNIIRTPNDFYTASNGIIYAAICELDDRNMPRDVITVSSVLRESGKLSLVGGPSALEQLTQLSNYPENLEAHARIVANLAMQRRMVVLLQQCAAEGTSAQSDPVKWRQDIAERVFNCAQNVVIDYVPGDAASIVESIRAGIDQPVRNVIPTGFSKYDALFYGGLTRKKEHIIGGTPGSCKTLLAGNIALHVAGLGYGVVFVTLEMTREELMERFISTHSRIQYSNLKNGIFRKFRDEVELYENTLDYLASLPLSIVEGTNLTAQEIRAAVRREHLNLERKFGTKVDLGLVVVDYLQMMNYEGSSFNDAKSLGNMNKQLLGFAREHNFALLALSQVTKDVEKRTTGRGKPDRRPIPADLRYSGDIIADAYSITFPYREDRYRPEEQWDNKAEILVRKNRNGKEGMFILDFDGPCMAFREPNYAAEQDPMIDEEEV